MSASVSDPDTLETLRALLRDAVTRLIEHAEALTDDLSEPVDTYRPTAEANSIAWLLWHAARAQDIQVADLAGAPQAWDRWVGRFGLDLDADDTGYGTPRSRSPRCARRPSCSSATTATCTSAPWSMWGGSTPRS